MEPPTALVTFTDAPGPVHEHDCPAGCTYLGTIITADRGTEDLYVHPRTPSDDSDLIRRTGPDGEYGSLPVDSIDRMARDSPNRHVYDEIRRRAVERGLL